MPGKRAFNRRAGRPPQRRQVHALQSRHRFAPRRSSRPIAGTTRDVIAQPAEWQGAAFTLVDTGGMFGASEDPLHELVVQHGKPAVAAADVIVFVVDGREGLVSGRRGDRRGLTERESAGDRGS